MTRFPRLMSRAAAAALVVAALALTGCNHYDYKTQQQVKHMSSQFNTVVAAYKSGQFTLDGGVLSSADLGSHFAYLKDQGELPKRVLLVPSDKSKITHQHLAYMALMALDYGFTVYYDKKGELVKVKAKAAKHLRQYKARHATAADREVQEHSAAHNPYTPSNPADGNGGGG